MLQSAPSTGNVFFGEIVGQEMRLNEMGKVVQEEWLKTKDVRSNVDLDKFVVMPNHIHGILMIKDSLGGGNEQFATRRGESQYAPTAFESPSNTVGAIVRGFKSACTKRINEIRRMLGQAVWQRGFHDRVIRNEQDLNRIRKYIESNVANWNNDEENPLIRKT